MYDRILIPTDGSKGAERGVEEGLALAEASDATAHLLFVVDEDLVGHTPALGLEELSIDRVERHARELLGEIADRAAARDVEAVEHVVRGDPSNCIMEYAETHDIDVVVMGKHGIKDYDRPHVGSVTDRVLRGCGCPVMPV
jgi:nucleotide-binding universal stress UspA family protein